MRSLQAVKTEENKSKHDRFPWFKMKKKNQT